MKPSIVLAGIVASALVRRHSAGELGLLIMAMVGLLLASFAVGPSLVLAVVRLLGHRHGAEALLASRRLRADPRSAGRVAGVLVVCGVALGIEGVLVAELLFDTGFGDDSGFYLTGYSMAALAVLVAATVALLTLLVGAADSLLDARRPLSTLAVLGVDERTLVRVLALQLSVTAVPPIALGALLGGPLIALLIGLSNGEHALGATVRALPPSFVVALAAALVLGAVARLAARLLRSLIRAAVDPENPARRLSGDLRGTRSLRIWRGIVRASPRRSTADERPDRLHGCEPQGGRGHGAEVRLRAEPGVPLRAQVA